MPASIPPLPRVWPHTFPGKETNGKWYKVYRCLMCARTFRGAIGLPTLEQHRQLWNAVPYTQKCTHCHCQAHHSLIYYAYKFLVTTPTTAPSWRQRYFDPLFVQFQKLLP